MFLFLILFLNFYPFLSKKILISKCLQSWGSLPSGVHNCVWSLFHSIVNGSIFRCGIVRIALLLWKTTVFNSKMFLLVVSKLSFSCRQNCWKCTYFCCWSHFTKETVFLSVIAREKKVAGKYQWNSSVTFWGSLPCILKVMRI